MNANIRERRSESGFTLIELLVVMIIIAILMAVAVPTFLAQKNNALKTKATSNIKQVITALESCAAQIPSGGYRQAANATTGDIAIDCGTAATLTNLERSLTSLQISTAAPTGVTQQGRYQVVVSPQGSGYVVQTLINDSNVPVYFYEAHAANGVIVKNCAAAAFTNTAGLDTQTFAAPTVAPVATSKTCKTGKWG